MISNPLFLVLECDIQIADQHPFKLKLLMNMMVCAQRNTYTFIKQT